MLEHLRVILAIYTRWGAVGVVAPFQVQCGAKPQLLKTQEKYKQAHSYDIFNDLCYHNIKKQISNLPFIKCHKYVLFVGNWTRIHEITAHTRILTSNIVQPVKSFTGFMFPRSNSTNSTQGTLDKLPLQCHLRINRDPTWKCQCEL